MKIRRMGDEWFHADGRTDRHDEANSNVMPLQRTTRLGNAIAERHCVPTRGILLTSTCLVKVHCHRIGQG
jgi:hypothetical protein